ncbi:uncharacterized protein RJT20DRAFT_40447 [Scheffersomyces xylosifermentans]|uniref:uncharacterized protein n=1 Tax=Scheffersomyces xylosifermentans TaxID=1304137 RepID=UPI00315DE5A6
MIAVVSLSTRSRRCILSIPSPIMSLCRIQADLLLIMFFTFGIISSSYTWSLSPYNNFWNHFHKTLLYYTLSLAVYMLLCLAFVCNTTISRL